MNGASVIGYAALLPLPMRVHVCAQEIVDLGLIALALQLKPAQYVTVHAQGDLFFLGNGLQSAPDDSLGKEFGSDLFHIGEIDLVIGQVVEFIQISLRFV